MIFQYGTEMVLFEQILIGFEAMLDNNIQQAISVCLSVVMLCFVFCNDLPVFFPRMGPKSFRHPNL